LQNEGLTELVELGIEPIRSKVQLLTYTKLRIY